MKQAVPVMDEPVEPVDEDELECSDEEVQYKEFKGFLTKNNASEMQRLEERCVEYSDSDWFEDEIRKWGAWKDSQLRKTKESMCFSFVSLKIDQTAYKCFDMLTIIVTIIRKDFQHHQNNTYQIN